MAHRNWAHQIVILVVAAIALIVAIGVPFFSTVGITSMPGWLAVVFGAALVVGLSYGVFLFFTKR
jgi:hypothetical protein